ncbi:MAG: gliding motility-associated C-terminal domain-containing protein, partial [Bacteroidia bacterium]|nr:gliding motility-associated C-terminal domain-containing protein [Bacteroidia bacterium]
LSNNVFDASNQPGGIYQFEFRLEDGIAPLGCGESQTIDVYVKPHISADLELVDAACIGSPSALQLNLSGSAFYDVHIIQDGFEDIEISNIENGHFFESLLDENTSFSIASITGSSSNCGFVTTKDTYTFEARKLEATIQPSILFDGYGVSCPEAQDGALSVEISAGTGPYRYSWSNGSTAPSLDNISAGWYTLALIDSAGCLYMDSFFVTAPTPVQLNISESNPACSEGLGILTLTSIEDPYSESWDLFLDDEAIFVRSFPFIRHGLSDGYHSLEIINAKGCATTYDFEIQIPEALQIYQPNEMISLGQSVNLAPQLNFIPQSITWSPSDYLSCTECPNPIVNQPLNSTNYLVQATDDNGCAIEKLIQVTVKKERQIFLPTGFTPNGDGQNDQLIVHSRSDLQSIESLEIYDRWGELIFSTTDIVPSIPIIYDWSFRGSELPVGTYMYRVRTTFIDGVELDFTGSFELLR